MSRIGSWEEQHTGTGVRERSREGEVCWVRRQCPDLCWKASRARIRQWLARRAAAVCRHRRCNASFLQPSSLRVPAKGATVGRGAGHRFYQPPSSTRLCTCTRAHQDKPLRVGCTGLQPLPSRQTLTSASHPSRATAGLPITYWLASSPWAHVCVPLIKITGNVPRQRIGLPIHSHMAESKQMVANDFSPPLSERGSWSRFLF
jgi:hypothetical protein